MVAMTNEKYGLTHSTDLQRDMVATILLLRYISDTCMTITARRQQ
jgi:hypothetical protein